MWLRNHLKIESYVAIIILFLLFNSFIALSPDTVSEVHAQEGYTYYGYVPVKMYQYNLTDPMILSSGWRLEVGSVSNTSLIAITAMEDNTQVKVYILGNDIEVSGATINSMQTHYVVLRNGTFFKVETSELASVLLLDYGSVPLKNATSGPLPNTFYQSTSGAYVDKEFVLMASNFNTSAQYVIFALENAEVIVAREDGNQRQYSIKANTWKELILNTFTVYKIQSTGNIMVQSGRPSDIWGDDQSHYHNFFVPAVEGGFVGKIFYTRSTTSWDPTENYGFRVSATQNAKVTLWNLETQEPMWTKDVEVGDGLGFKPLAPAIVLQSDQPITLEYLHNGSIEHSSGHNLIYGAYGSGVAYFGVKPNEDTPFFLSVDSYVQAYIFASEDTQVIVDGTPRMIGADSYYLVTDPGPHIINSNKKVVVEILSWPNTPEYQGLKLNGVQISCVQTVDVVPNVTLTPLGAGFSIMYVIIGAVAAGVSAIVAFLFLKGRSKK